MKYLIKIDRIAAWALFILLTLYFISGYGMTKGLIDSKLATNLHLNILTYFILVAFVIHTAFAIRLALMRWKIWHSFGKFLWVLFYLVFISGFIYIDRFYKVPNQTSAFTPSNNSVVTTQNDSATSNTKTFTLDELAQYNGQNNHPPYVAVDGVVYDMTGVFNDGFHYSHFAGKDLTGAFYIRHVKSQITKYPVVGKLIK